MRHPHIGIVQCFVRRAMILRGLDVESESRSVPEDLVYLKKFDAEGRRSPVIRGRVTRSGITPTADVAAPRPKPTRRSPLFGHGPDFGYLYYGAIW